MLPVAASTASNSTMMTITFTAADTCSGTLDIGADDRDR
jgi:hypothetical protein